MWPTCQNLKLLYKKNNNEKKDDHMILQGYKSTRAHSLHVFRMSLSI